MTREDRLDMFAMEAMKATIARGGMVNTYALARDAYTLADEMLKRRHLVLEEIILGDTPSRLIDDMPFTVRTSNCLRDAKIHTLGQLEQWTENELIKLPNLGRKSLKEIIEELARVGLKLRTPFLLEGL
jgi:DNA-directed RNA polymerase alpha subunit